MLSSTTACEFLSTPSVGRATETNPSMGVILNISIHALRGEGDASPST